MSIQNEADLADYDGVPNTLLTVELASRHLILRQLRIMIPVKCGGHLPVLGQGKVTHDGTGTVTHSGTVTCSRRGDVGRRCGRGTPASGVTGECYGRWDMV